MEPTMVIENIISVVLSILIWVAIVGGILWLAGLKWKSARYVKDGYFTLVKTVTIAIVIVLFKPLERSGIGNLSLNENDPERRP